MGLVRYLQHWLGGAGPRLQVADFVPDPHPLRQWADTFPWAALVAAVEQSFATRFPKRSRRGRPPIPIRVLLALELLKHEVGASDEAICARLRTDFAVMYACGLREYQALREQASFVLPETLCEFRSRIDEVLMDELIAIQAAAAMEAGLVSPAHLVVDTFPCEQQPTGHGCDDAVQGAKKTLTLIADITQCCSSRATRLRTQGHDLHQELKKVMRSFGRQCRGQGRVFVKLVRQTERQLLELGQPIPVLGRQAQQLLEETETLPAVQRERLTRQLRSALAAQAQIRKQSGRLTQGKKLGHCKLVNAYDLTIAPILKGKSNCPAQFGRKPGLMSEPATGFIFATRVPAGNPYDASYVVPLLDQVQRAIDRVGARKRRQVHSVAGDLGINDATVRQTLHERGILTIGIPQTVAPIDPKPTAEAIRSILTDAGLTQKRTPAQMQIACACGYSRPVVESHIASLLARGAGQVRYQGLAGAVVQQGMTVMAHNGATLARLPYQRLSKRAHKLRRLLRLKSPNPLENQEGKN